MASSAWIIPVAIEQTQRGALCILVFRVHCSLNGQSSEEEGRWPPLLNAAKMEQSEIEEPPLRLLPLQLRHLREPERVGRDSKFRSIQKLKWRSGGGCLAIGKSKDQSICH
ncbi:hypothetical protein TYRP_011891 [Tyrophagus putrescentiae]|nr:hypothetical protein TYRP_011891 [Tyrophagus putrescentiae]